MPLTNSEKQKRYRIRQKGKMQMVKLFDLYFETLELMLSLEVELYNLREKIIERRKQNVKSLL